MFSSITGSQNVSTTSGSTDRSAKKRAVNGSEFDPYGSTPDLPSENLAEVPSE